MTPFVDRPLQAQEQGQALEAAHAALAEGHYGHAVRLYADELRRGSRWEWLPDLIQTVEQRQRLRDVAPLDTHRIAILFVTRTTVVRRDGGREERPDVTLEQRALWRSRLGALRRVVEAFSGGAWTLSFEELDAEATRREGSPQASPDDFDLAAHFERAADSLDTWIIISSHVVDWGGGFVRRFPIVNGVLYGPHRGSIALHASRHGFLEAARFFFHVTERVAGIRPLRGHRDSERQHFPAWRGTTDFDYYRWHFATTLASERWNRLNPRYLWRLRPDRAAAYERVSNAYRSMLRGSLARSQALAREAGRAAESHSLRAISLYERALELNPYEPEIVRPLLRLYRSRPPTPSRMALLQRRNADIRTLTDITEVLPPFALSLERGHVAFAAGRYVEAAAFYDRSHRVEDGGQMAANLRAIVDVRRRLGDVAPPDTHRVGVIAVRHIVTLDEGRRSAVRPDVLDEHRRTMRVRLGVLQRLVEAFTAGGLTLAFEEAEATAFLDEGTAVADTTLDRLDVGGWFAETMNRVDSYLVLSTSASPGLGGAHFFAVISGVIRGPQRGFFLINPSHHGVDIVLHEFFHAVEAAEGIRPAHGFEPHLRRNFPAWHGADEFDYYRWHFDTTLRRHPWSRLLLRQRSPVSEGRLAAWRTVAAAYAGIPLDSVLRAREVEGRAQTMEAASLSEAVGLYERTLAQSPFSRAALERLVVLYASDPDRSERRATYEARLEILRTLR